MRMVSTEAPLGVGEGPLVQRDRLGESSRRLVGGGEVVAGGQGVGVVITEDPLTISRGPLKQRDLGLPAPSTQQPHTTTAPGPISCTFRT